MKELFKRTLNKKGETLAETIVSIALFALLASAIFTAAGFCVKITEREKNENRIFEEEYFNIDEDALIFNRTATVEISIEFDAEDSSGTILYTALPYMMESAIINISEAGLTQWEKP